MTPGAKDEVEGPDLPPEGDEKGAEGARGFVADAVRKAFLAGVGALFMTEEGARRLARDWKLPKEVISYVAAQASGAKEEVLRVLGDEIRRFFQSDALRREFLKLLTSMAIEVRAEVRLKETRGGKVKPSVSASVLPKIQREEASGEGGEEPPEKP